ncbi:MAG: hypothetical protein ACKO23_05185, partial [Gemmataceae bacterium]
ATYPAPSEVVDRWTFILVGHRRFLLGGVKHFQENLDGPPLQLRPPGQGTDADNLGVSSIRPPAFDNHH